MKKIWVFLLGVLAGVIVTIILLIALGSREKMVGMTFFEQPGEVVDATDFKVFQALRGGTALATGKENGDYSSGYFGLNVLLYNQEGTLYYDDQVVTAPMGMCFRQVGIYKYSSRMGEKTVPIIMLVDY